MATFKLKKKHIIIAAVTLVVVAALALLAIWLRHSDFWDILTHKDKLRTWIKSFGAWAPLVFFGIQVSQVIVSLIPGNVITLAGGAIFGFWQSFLLSTLAIVGAAMTGFFVVRWMGHTVIKKLVGAEMYDKYSGYLNKDTSVSRARTFILITMILPFFPDDVICLLAGLTAISSLDFFLIIIFTRPFGIALTCWAGAYSEKIPLWLWIATGVLLAAVCVLAIKYAAVVERKTLESMGKIENWFRRLLRLAPKQPVNETTETTSAVADGEETTGESHEQDDDSRETNAGERADADEQP